MLKAALLYSCLVSLAAPSFVSHHHKKSTSAQKSRSYSPPPHSSYQPSTSSHKHYYVFVPSKPEHVVVKSSHKSHTPSYSVRRVFTPEHSYKKSSHVPSRSYAHRRRLPSRHGYSKPSSSHRPSSYYLPKSGSRGLPSIYASSPTFSSNQKSISTSHGKSSHRGDSSKSSRHSYTAYTISEQTKKVVNSMREKNKHQESKPDLTTSSAPTSSASTASSTTSPPTTTATKKEEKFNLEENTEYDVVLEYDSEGRITDPDSDSDAEYDANGSRDENVDYSDGNVDYNPDSNYFSK